MPNSLRLLCSIDIRNLRLLQTGDLRKGAVGVYVIQQDGIGKVLSQWTKTQPSIFGEAVRGSLKSGMPFRQDVQPKTASQG